jgi:hypothetical protein
MPGDSLRCHSGAMRTITTTTAVVPGRASWRGPGLPLLSFRDARSAGPESITTTANVARSWGGNVIHNRRPWLWIPGSRQVARPGMTAVGMRAPVCPLRHNGTTGKIPLHADPKSVAMSKHPVPTGGADRERHERGTGSGGRESVGAQGLAGRVEPRERVQGAQDDDVSSVRQNRVVPTPVAGAKPALTLQARPGLKHQQAAGDGDKTNSSPRRARHKPSSHHAGDAGCLR